jgi:hypothetical protein
MEHAGVPIDMEIFPQLADPIAWHFVRDAMVPEIDAAYAGRASGAVDRCGDQGGGVMGDGGSQTQRRSKAEWDAEIEADFQHAVAATKTAGRKKRGRRLVGFPFAFLAHVCRLTGRRATLVVAVLIYRRMCVCGSQTVICPLPS